MENGNNGKLHNGKFAPKHKLGNRFKKGESGNPAGRPVGSKNVSTVLREMLQQMAPKEVIDSKFVKEFCKGKTHVTLADAVAARLFMEAIINGDLGAIREILDRLEGKPRQAIDVDMQLTDWRQIAESAGLNEEDVIREAKLILSESANGDGSS